MMDGYVGHLEKKVLKLEHDLEQLKARVKDITRQKCEIREHLEKMSLKYKRLCAQQLQVLEGHKRKSANLDKLGREYNEFRRQVKNMYGQEVYMRIIARIKII